MEWGESVKSKGTPDWELSAEARHIQIRGKQKVNWKFKKEESRAWASFEEKVRKRNATVILD